MYASINITSNPLHALLANLTHLKLRTYRYFAQGTIKSEFLPDTLLVTARQPEKSTCDNVGQQAEDMSPQIGLDYAYTFTYTACNALRSSRSAVSVDTEAATVCGNTSSRTLIRVKGPFNLSHSPPPSTKRVPPPPPGPSLPGPSLEAGMDDGRIGVRVNEAAGDGGEAEPRLECLARLLQLAAHAGLIAPQIDEA